MPKQSCRLLLLAVVFSSIKSSTRRFQRWPNCIFYLEVTNTNRLWFRVTYFQHPKNELGTWKKHLFFAGKSSSKPNRSVLTLLFSFRQKRCVIPKSLVMILSWLVHCLSKNPLRVVKCDCKKKKRKAHWSGQTKYINFHQPRFPWK